MNKILIAVLAMAVPVSGAEGACWTPRQISVAAVRDLDAMLMVAALRCRTTDISVMERYNGFVEGHRKALVQVNDTLREHFADAGNKLAVLNAYDNYVTKVANRYGAGAEGLTCADMGSIVEAASAEATTVDALIAVAERAGVKPFLDTDACPVAVAAVTETVR